MVGKRGTERRRGFSVRDELQVLAPLVFTWAVGLVVLAIVSARKDVGSLLLDRTYAAGVSWYVGFVASIGVLAWSVAATSGAAGAWLAWQLQRHRASRFLGTGAALSALLCVDDLFALHATVAPRLGIPKKLAEVILAQLIALWLLRWRDEIGRTRKAVLGAALGANAMSLLVDITVNPDRFSHAILWEDGPKCLGILAWSAYFVITSHDIGRSALQERLPGSDNRLGQDRPVGIDGSLYGAAQGNVGVEIEQPRHRDQQEQLVTKVGFTLHDR